MNNLTKYVTNMRINSLNRRIRRMQNATRGADFDSAPRTPSEALKQMDDAILYHKLERCQTKRSILYHRLERYQAKSIESYKNGSS